MERLDKRFKNIQPAVIAVFKDRTQLDKTLTDLKKGNFKNEDISVLMAKRKDIKEISFDEDIMVGVITGAVIGLIEGAVMCLMASLNLVTIPGSSTFITAGPLLSVIAGAAVGVNAGALAGALVGYGIAKVEARRIESYIKNKGAIISVHAEEPKEQLIAKNILVTNGALKIFNPLDKDSKRTTRKLFTHRFREA